MRFRLRTLLILVAVMPPLLAGIAVELCRLLEVVRLGRTQRLPPTMYGEHAGIAVALFCMALILLLLIERRSHTEASRLGHANVPIHNPRLALADSGGG